MEHSQIQQIFLTLISHQQFLRIEEEQILEGYLLTPSTMGKCTSLLSGETTIKYPSMTDS